MRCKNCGTPLKDGTKFCTKCGAPVTKKSLLRAIPMILLVLVIALGAGLTACRTQGSSGDSDNRYFVSDERDENKEKKQRDKEEEAAEKTTEETAEEAARSQAAETETAEAQAEETETTEAQAAGTQPAEWPTGEPLTLPAVMPETGYAAAPGTGYAVTPETGYAVMPGTEAGTSGVLMQVVNCDEWISLRTAPSTSADRIMTIPLGAYVTWLDSAPDGFCLVEYQGNIGFALGQYLQAVR